MSKIRNKVVRQVHEHPHTLANYPEYAGYKLYLIEAQTSNWQLRSMQYILTQDFLAQGDTLDIDEGTELLPVGVRGSTPYIGNLKLHVYRPERYLEDDFTILSAVQDGEPVEKFGGQEMDRRIYTLYQAERQGTYGRPGSLVRIFTKALYAPGLSIPANEVIGLPVRNSLELPHYHHDMDSKAYKDRVWKAVKSFF